MMKIMTNKESLKTDDRLIIRDSYGYKHYEIIKNNGHTAIYCYALGRFLNGKEIKELKNKISELEVNQ